MVVSIIWQPTFSLGKSTHDTDNKDIGRGFGEG